MKSTLTKSQKAVLYVDVTHPEMTDIELSEIIGISAGRISAIRSRLIKSGYYKEIKIPSLDLLGFEMIGVAMLEFKSAKALDAPEASRCIGAIASHPNVLYSAQCGPNLVIITAFPRLVTFEAFVDGFSEMCEKAIPGRRQEMICSFPLELSTVWSFWEFSSILRDRFGSHLPDSRAIGFDSEAVGETDLDIDEVRILDMMAQHPTANDASLAKRADVSLSSFRRVKDMLISKGLFRRAFLPDLRRMGFQIIGFSLMRVNPAADRGLDHGGDILSPWPFLYISRRNRAFIANCFVDYASYDKYLSKVCGADDGDTISLENMASMVCSVQRMREIRSLNFSGLVSTLLPAIEY